MRDITLDSVTQDQFNESSQTLINMIRTRYPQLDLRSGTALRDLLVSPDAIIDAWGPQNLISLFDQLEKTLRC